MSYDLTFWRQHGPVDQTPQEILRIALDGRPVDGLATLPIEDMRARLGEIFHDWSNDGSNIWSQRDDGSGPAFDLFTTEQVFHVTCYGMPGADMNRLIDLGLEFDCPLFDPQTNERFD